MTHLVGRTYSEQRVMKLMQHGIAHIAAHTNWDACPGGLNDFLADQLGLIDVRPIGTANPRPVFKLVVFLPVADRAMLVDALASAGAGTIGNYDRCAFSVEGTGQFRALDGANPTIGKVGVDEFVEESRLEMLVLNENVVAVEKALRASHPYEEPAYEFTMLKPLAASGIIRIGTLREPLSLRQFQAQCREKLANHCETWGGPEWRMEKVAVCGGAADDEWRNAQAEGAQVLVTGEVRQHNALEAAESGFAMIAAGHYATEHPSMMRLVNELKKALPGVRWELYEPSPGVGGRPL